MYLEGGILVKSKFQVTNFPITSFYFQAYFVKHFNSSSFSTLLGPPIHCLFTPSLSFPYALLRCSHSMSFSCSGPCLSPLLACSLTPCPFCVYTSRKILLLVKSHWSLHSCTPQLNMAGKKNTTMLTALTLNA